MPSITRVSGITVSVTGPAEFAREAPRAKRGAKAQSRRAATARAPGDGGLVVAAMRAQEFELVDSIPVQIPPAARPRKRGGAAPSSAVTLDVPLGADEHAVILLDDEGEYRWIVDGEALSTPSPMKRGRGKAVVPKRQIRFSIEVKAAAPTPAIAVKRGGVKRNWLVDKLVGKVTAYVFRFAVKAAGKQVVRYFERKVTQGLVAIGGTDTKDWTLLADNKIPFTPPPDRPARVLLFIHGTFSSTVGSYGALGVVPAGKVFLKNAIGHYDAVLGFDHRTLSVDPRENAVDLLARLQEMNWPQPPQLDMVAFSRGGLVARSLIEDLLPGSRLRATVGCVVFVGCTNGGTQLAEPDNWHRFADHYTNLALGAARALSLIPAAQGATMIGSQAIRGVGALVKALATGVVTDNLAPGIAAMEPDGRFIKHINSAQPGQPDAVDARYYAVMSNFEAGKALRTGSTLELPPKLLMRIADWGADELYGEANDLVVHVRSMTEIDPKLGDFVKDTLDYGTNGSVYHTNYFTRDTTAARLAQWFGLGATPPAAAKRRARRKGHGRMARPGSAAKRGREGTKLYAKRKPGGRLVGSQKHKLTSAAKLRPKAKAKHAVKKKKKLAKARLRVSNVSEIVRRRSGPLGVKKRSAKKKGGGGGGRPRTMGVSRGVGKATARSKPPDRSAAGGGVGARPPSRGSRGQKLRSTSNTDPAQVECQFRAEMDEEVVVNKKVSVDVTIARHALEVAASRVGDTATAGVEPEKKLIVEITERRNFRVDGKRRVEVDVPAPGAEVSRSFDVTGLLAGEEGELWVQVRQGSVPLVTLKLKSRILAKAGPGPVARVPVQQALAEFPEPDTSLDELRIVETEIGTGVQYLYLLDLRSLGINGVFKSPVIKVRDSYITTIMNNIGDAWTGPGRAQVRAFENDLKSIGATMFTDLMPREMQDLLWDNRNRIRHVQVLSMEPFIPWELVCLQDPKSGTIGKSSKFLGELGLVRWLYEGYPPKRITLGQGRARYVIPKYTGDLKLPESDQEEKLLRKLFDAKKVPARVRDVQKIVRAVGTFDLLHFGGHAEAAGTDQAHARLILEQSDPQSTEDALLATTVAKTAELNDDGRRPIVVLNACESARMNRTFAGMGGFASAFVSRGAGVFVGTHWSVGDTPARTFIQAFYEAFALPKKRPLTLSEAVMRARQAARKAGDATWLAYVVYGHPRAVVTAE